MATNSPYKMDFLTLWEIVAHLLSNYSTQMALSTRAATLHMRHLTVLLFKHLLVDKWVKYLLGSIQQVI